MRGVFLRGAFTEHAVDASAHVLTAYGFGLIAIVLIRSVVASFQSIGDTHTPMLISLVSRRRQYRLQGRAVQTYGRGGPGSRDRGGAWLNLILLGFFALRRNLLWPDDLLAKSAASASIAALHCRSSRSSLPCRRRNSPPASAISKMRSSSSASLPAARSSMTSCSASAFLSRAYGCAACRSLIARRREAARHARDGARDRLVRTALRSGLSRRA